MNNVHQIINGSLQKNAVRSNDRNGMASLFHQMGNLDQAVKGALPNSTTILDDSYPIDLKISLAESHVLQIEGCIARKTWVISPHFWLTKNDDVEAILAESRAILQSLKDSKLFREAIVNFDAANGSIEIWEGREDEYDNFEPTDDYLDYINENEQFAIDSDDIDSAEFWNGLYAEMGVAAHD